jgi:heavy metal translocating P-type ATPase
MADFMAVKPSGGAPGKPGGSAVRSAVGLVRLYPIAGGALVGIVLGISLLPLHRSAAMILLAGVGVAGAIPLVLRTIRQMLRGQFHVDLIAAVAIVASLILHEYLAAALVVLMQSGGEALEDYGLRRANRSLENLLRRAPSVAQRRSAESGEFVAVPASEVQVGDLLLVRPGDIVAADGVVVEGQGGVDEAALTGEPVPLPKLPGDKVFSGTVNLNGSFVVRATSAAAQSKYERIVRMVQNAQGERAPINRLANKYTPAFTGFAFMLAIGAGLLSHDPVRAVAVLVVATPCPLLIATPLAVLSAINRAAAMNIIVKSGAAVEQAGEVDTVVFDKTGTLTIGTPLLGAIWLVGPEGDVQPGATDPARADALLAGAAAVEMLSPHILASAIVHAARERGFSVTPAADVREAPGTGVAGNWQGRRYAIGSGGFLASEGITVPDDLRQVRARLGGEGRTVAYVAVDGTVAGMLAFEDRVRPEAPTLIRRLNAMGIRRIVMLTGDAPETAHAVAEQIGIVDVRARMHPEDKLTAIDALRADGEHKPASVVMMVGDGINDAPALAKASVGVAMGGYGAGIATDAADVVITVENVERVADAISIGRRMVAVAKQGILFGIGVSVLLMLLASAGRIPPAIGALLQELLDLATILNALRARRG